MKTVALLSKNRRTHSSCISRKGFVINPSLPGDVDDIMREASSLLWKKYDLYDPERPGTLAPTDPCGLRGMVDELYDFNQAVLLSHASSLHMENTPDQIVDGAFVPWRFSTLSVVY